MTFYIKKTYVDTEPGIELVNIHYTCTPVNKMPNWETHRETRAMPRGGVLVRGMGGTTLDESGQYVQTAKVGNFSRNNLFGEERGKPLPMLPAAAVPIVEEVRVFAVEIAWDLEHSLTRLGMSVRHDHQYLRFFLPVPFRRFSQG